MFLQVSMNKAKVYFCTNIDLRYQYRHVQEEEVETWNAFLRRIENVCVMVDGHTSTYPTDIYMTDQWFFLSPEAPDPFEPEYKQMEMSI